jgi:hypothetical protein
VEKRTTEMKIALFLCTQREHTTSLLQVQRCGDWILSQCMPSFSSWTWRLEVKSEDHNVLHSKKAANCTVPCRKTHFPSPAVCSSMLNTAPHS